MRELNEILTDEPHTAAQMKELLDGFPMTDLLDQWGSLDDNQKQQIFHALDHDEKGYLLITLPAAEQEKLTEIIPDDDFRELLSDMEPDDLVDFIQAASVDIRKTLWQKLSAESKREILYLLRFDEDDAAGLMTPASWRSRLKSPSPRLSTSCARTRARLRWSTTSTWWIKSGGSRESVH